MSDNGDVFQAKYIAKQRPAPPSTTEDTKVQCQCYPPLGQVTSVEDSDILFIAVLEVPKTQSQDPWEASLWHSVDDAGWLEAALFPVDSAGQPLDLQPQSDSTARLYFTTPLSFEKAVQFTLKFRSNEGESWRWIRDEQGLGDGVVVTTSASVTSEELSDRVPDINSNWAVSSRMSQSPRTRLWTLETTIPAAEGEASTFKDLSIGTPWGSFVR